MSIRKIYKPDLPYFTSIGRHLYEGVRGTTIGKLHEVTSLSKEHDLLYGSSNLSSTEERELLNSDVGVISNKLSGGEDSLPTMNKWKLKEIEFYQKLYKVVLDGDIDWLLNNGHYVGEDRELYVLNVQAKIIDTDDITESSYTLQVLLGGKKEGDQEVSYILYELTGSTKSLLTEPEGLYITDALIRHEYRKESLLRNVVYRVEVLGGNVSDLLYNEYERVKTSIAMGTNVGDASEVRDESGDTVISLEEGLTLSGNGLYTGERLLGELKEVTNETKYPYLMYGKDAVNYGSSNGVTSKEIMEYKHIYSTVLHDINLLYRVGNRVSESTELYVLDVKVDIHTGGETFTATVIYGARESVSTRVYYMVRELMGSIKHIETIQGGGITTLVGELEQHNYRRGTLLVDKFSYVQLNDTESEDLLRELYLSKRLEVPEHKHYTGTPQEELTEEMNTEVWGDLVEGEELVEEELLVQEELLSVTTLEHEDGKSLVDDTGQQEEDRTGILHTVKEEDWEHQDVWLEGLIVDDTTTETIVSSAVDVMLGDKTTDDQITTMEDNVRVAEQEIAKVRAYNDELTYFLQHGEGFDGEKDINRVLSKHLSVIVSNSNVHLSK